MILILVDAITPRLSYTLDFIFKERGISYELTTAQIDFEERDVSYRLNYSTRHSDIAKRIEPCTLLRESSIHDLKVDKGTFEELECLIIDDIPDPIASIFYIITRYEEYGVSVRDEHGRFSANDSVLVKFNWLEKAMCDRWARKIIEFIYPELYLESELRAHLMQPCKIVPTFDIDNAFAYKNKKASRTFFSVLKDVLKGNKENLQKRASVLKGEKDPYDTYDQIINIAENYLETKVFWLVRSNGEKDRNVPIGNAAHQEIIRNVSSKAKVGIHPSYGSFLDVESVCKEKNDLESVINMEVLAARFHFLRFQLPNSYQNLIDCGIREDHSMGFAEYAGFRAGTARSFHWFDLSRNERSDLVIYPFIYMDGTLNEYMGLQPKSAFELISKLYREVVLFGGDFRFIWHNETINDQGKWEGWFTVLEQTLELK